MADMLSPNQNCKKYFKNMALTILLKSVLVLIFKNVEMELKI